MSKIVRKNANYRATIKPYAQRKKKHRKTTLFARIMTGLTVPLFTLILLFTGVQLANSMKAINESYEIRSRFAFDSVHTTLAIALKDKEKYRDAPALDSLFQKLEEKHPGTKISLYDLLDRKLLFDRSGSGWQHFDAVSLEASLYHNQTGKDYFVGVNKEVQKVVAYIPLQNREGNIALIARVEFYLQNIIKDALFHSRWMLICMIALIALTGVAIGSKLSSSIVRPVQSLNAATQEIAEGHLGKHVVIETGDEIEALAKTFNKMSDTIKIMKKRAEDSNPLTQLPGNQGIFQELKSRIHERQKFVLYHTDIDRFKVFNDHFGLAKGDSAIKKTAALLKDAIATVGAPDDFVGHQGGDDFVIITRPNQAEKLAQYVIDGFDKRVLKELYSKEDFDRGHTLQIDRRRLAETGEERLAEFPLIAVSLAGVSNAKKDFADYFDCMSSAVSVKKEVKKTIQSSYIIKE